MVLNKDIILRWIWDGLPQAKERAQEKARSLPGRLARARELRESENQQRLSEDLSELRGIKHRLNIAKALAHCGQLSNDSVSMSGLTSVNNFRKLKRSLIQPETRRCKKHYDLCGNIGITGLDLGRDVNREMVHVLSLLRRQGEMTVFSSAHS